jgi:hypothetical protein
VFSVADEHPPISSANGIRVLLVGFLASFGVACSEAETDRCGGRSDDLASRPATGWNH